MAERFESAAPYPGDDWYALVSVPRPGSASLGKFLKLVGSIAARLDRIEPLRARRADDSRTRLCIRDTGVARASGLVMDVRRRSNDSLYAVSDAGLRLLFRAAGLPVEEICGRTVQATDSRILHYARSRILTCRSLLHVCRILWTGEMAIRTNTTSIQLAMARPASSKDSRADTGIRRIVRVACG